MQWEEHMKPVLEAFTLESLMKGKITVKVYLETNNIKRK